VEAVREDRRKVLPDMVENAKEPLYTVEADKVDVTTVLPCAVEKRRADTIVFITVARFIVRVLPVNVDIVRLNPLMVEPVRVDATDIIFAATVLPPRVDTYARSAWMVEPVILDTVTVLPRSVE
jgi:hypothetical protein